MGLGDGELSSEVGDVACSGSDVGVVAVDEDADGGSLARCRVADAEGEGEFVSIEVSGLGACFGRRGLLRKMSRSGDEVGVGVLGSL